MVHCMPGYPTVVYDEYDSSELSPGASDNLANDDYNSPERPPDADDYVSYADNDSLERSPGADDDYHGNVLGARRRKVASSAVSP